MKRRKETRTSDIILWSSFALAGGPRHGRCISNCRPASNHPWFWPSEPTTIVVLPYEPVANSSPLGVWRSRSSKSKTGNESKVQMLVCDPTGVVAFSAEASHHRNLEAVEDPFCLPKLRKSWAQRVGYINHSHGRPCHRQVPHAHRHQVAYKYLRTTQPPSVQTKTAVEMRQSHAMAGMLALRWDKQTYLAAAECDVGDGRQELVEQAFPIRRTWCSCIVKQLCHVP